MKMWCFPAKARLVSHWCFNIIILDISSTVVSEVAEYFFGVFFFLTHTVALFCVGLYQTRIETYLKQYF